MLMVAAVGVQVAARPRDVAAAPRAAARITELVKLVESVAGPVQM